MNCCHLIILPVFIQVNDDCTSYDVLSSCVELGVSNFRNLQGLPVYGMAQPTKEVKSRSH